MFSRKKYNAYVPREKLEKTVDDIQMRPTWIGLTVISQMQKSRYKDSFKDTQEY